MLKLFLLEFSKLKRSWIFVIALGGSLVAPVMSTLMFATGAVKGGTGLRFTACATYSHIFSSLIIDILLFGLVATFVVTREFQERTLSSVLTVPVGRGRFLTVKLLFVVFLAFLMTLTGFLGLLGCAALLGAQGLTAQAALDTLAYSLGGTALLVPCILAAVLVALVSRNYVVPIAFSVVVVILNIFLVNDDTLGGVFPWVIPFLLSMPPHSDNVDVSMVNRSLALSVSGGFGLLMAAANALWFRRANVD